MVTHLYGILGVILDRTFGNIIRMLRVIRLPKEERGHLSWTFVGTLAVILAYGLIMMFSASYSSGYTNHGGNIYYFIKPQAIVAAVGFVVMLGVSLINYRALRYMFWTFYVITLALLVLALALWCTLGVSAEDTTTTASGTAGSFQQIVAEVALDGYGIAALDLENHFTHVMFSFRLNFYVNYGILTGKI